MYMLMLIFPVFPLPSSPSDLGADLICLPSLTRIGLIAIAWLLCPGSDWSSARRGTTLMETSAPDLPIDAEAMCLSYVRDRDVACPLCGYNLRQFAVDTLPECGQALKASHRSSRSAAEASDGGARSSCSLRRRGTAGMAAIFRAVHKWVA